MAKVKKILAEANAGQFREIDLVDQNIGAIEECPSLSEFLFVTIFGIFWCGRYYCHVRCLDSPMVLDQM